LSTKRARVRSHRFAGMTLVEVLLVLAILATAASLAWPVLANSVASYRLRTAADTVRTEWCRTRVEAMRTGHTQSFRYSVAGPHFRTEQFDDLGLMVPAEPTPLPVVTFQAETQPGAQAGVGQCMQHALPEGIVFLGPDTPDLPVEVADAAADLLGDGDWSAPILFHADGTTSDARLALKNDRGWIMELTLRGLTGSVMVSDILDAQR